MTYALRVRACASAIRAFVSAPTGRVCALAGRVAYRPQPGEVAPTAPNRGKVDFRGCF